MSYQFLSLVYDECKKDFWIKNSEFFNFYRSAKDKSLLDLGCGTGLSIQYLQIDSNDYVGVDSSTDMLNNARKKFPQYTFYNQSILHFNHPKRFKFIICSFDTLNHFLHISEWIKIFDISFSHLKPNGTLIFDIFTLYDLTSNWPNQLNLVESEKWVYIQRSTYNSLKKLGIIDNTIFVKDFDKWTRYDEQIKNISINSEKVEDLLQKAGFREIKKIDFNTGREITETTERILFFCTKC